MTVEWLLSYSLRRHLCTTVTSCNLRRNNVLWMSSFIMRWVSRLQAFCTSYSWPFWCTTATRSHSTRASSEWTSSLASETYWRFDTRHYCRCCPRMALEQRQFIQIFPSFMLLVPLCVKLLERKYGMLLESLCDDFSGTSRTVYNYLTYYTYCSAGAFVDLQWIMATVLAVNRYTALCNPLRQQSVNFLARFYFE